MTTNEIKEYITNYCNTHNIQQDEYALHPLYLHLDGFSHSIGFAKTEPHDNEIVTDYDSVGYSAYMSECERNIWGYANEHQKNIAKHILSTIPHYIYKNNAKEILF